MHNTNPLFSSVQFIHLKYLQKRGGSYNDTIEKSLLFLLSIQMLAFSFKGQNGHVLQGDFSLVLLITKKRMDGKKSCLSWLKNGSKNALALASSL